MAGSSCLPGVSRGCLLCCPGEHLVPSTGCSSQCWDVSEEEPAGGLRVREVLGGCAWRDGLEPGMSDTGLCWAAFLEKTAWCPCRSASFRGSGFLKLQTMELLLCGSYNLPTPILTSLRDTRPSCSEGTWVTIQEDSSSLHWTLQRGRDLCTRAERSLFEGDAN